MRWSSTVRLIAVGVLGLTAAAALSSRLPAGVSAALDAADTFEVLSIEPERADAGTTTAPADFHGQRVLGRLSMTDPG